MRRTKFLAAAGAVALIVPAVVIAGITGSNPESGTPNGQTLWATEQAVTAEGNGYKAVEGGMPQGTDFAFDYTEPTTVHISVDMRSGSAKLRILSNASEGTTGVEPKSVLISGKGVTTATFVYLAQGLQEPRIEWKPVGNKPAKAASIVASAIGQID